MGGDPTARIVVRPATPARWRDVEDLFERRGPRGGRPYTDGCWCVLWRMPAKDHRAGWDSGANKGVLVDIVRRGDRPGLLAYQGGTPIGWCALSPRAALPRIRSSPSVADLPEEDDEGIWSLSCFYVHGSHKRTGVAAALITAAIDTARKAGARVLEGYPVQPGHGDPFTGYAAQFEATGFTVTMGDTSRGLARLDL